MIHSKKILLFVWVVAALVGTCRPRTSTSSSKAGASDTASIFTPGNRNASWEGKDHYLGEIQPILASRCVACHGCNDAPCSAKLTSYEGIARGASKNNPYAVHINGSTFPDPRPGVAAGFFPIINKNMNENLMFRYLALGAKNSTDGDKKGPFNFLLLDGLRKQYQEKPSYECPANSAEFDALASKYYEYNGMPFGLSRVSDDEQHTLMTWLAEAGGKGPEASAAEALRRPSNVALIQEWDRFLNPGPTVPVRTTLMARYIYEHIFNAHVAFDEMPGEFYRLVRTHDAPGPSWSEPTEMITELPTDAPIGEGPVYYRFKKFTEVVAQKAHTVFALNRGKIAHYEQLFLSKSNLHTWSVKELPGYTSADPFKNFAAIPGKIRYRFMLENAHYIVDSMVRAPVCVGEAATYAIADHFWAFFLKPEVDPSSGAVIQMDHKGFDGLTLDVTAWTPLGQIEDRFVRNYKYIESFEDALRKDLARRGKKSLGLDDLWYGEPLGPGGKAKDRNAWLSITRHDISTTVQYGIEGGMPQSLWVLNYANFERLYYNLVVNFKYWGDPVHKLGTWRSMSHERMDGEDLFLSMLPVPSRERIRNEWSGGLELGDDLASLAPLIGSLIKLKTGVDIGNKTVKRYIDLYPLQSLRGTPRPGVDLPGIESAEVELARLIRDRMAAGGVSKANDPLNARRDGETIFTPVKGVVNRSEKPKITSFEDWERAMARLGEDRGMGRYATWLPASTIARVYSKSGESRVYSFIGNRGYTSHNLALLAGKKPGDMTRVPEKDTLSIYRGVVGDRPEMFLDIPLEATYDGQSYVDAQALLELIQRMDETNHVQIFQQLRGDYAVKRNSAKFWPFYDWLHNWMVTHESDAGPGLVYAGVLDLMRYDPEW